MGGNALSLKMKLEAHSEIMRTAISTMDKDKDTSFSISGGGALQKATYVGPPYKGVRLPRQVVGVMLSS